METIYIILNILLWLIYIFLSLSTIYILIFSLAGIFPYRPKEKNTKYLKKIVVLIPAYKEDSVIKESANEALKQTYPSDKFDVIVIADSFKTETIEYLKSLPVKVIEVSFEMSTKSKALNKAMEQLPEDYEIAVVLDADNIMEKEFLFKINSMITEHCIAVQGHRVAKNMNTSFAILDAISEEINNHIFRKGHRNLGLSSAIIGSGMAFEYQYFKNLMKNVTAIGGFDKEIELKMLKDGKVIEYLPDASVYDEKVQKSEVFSNQRRRWLSAQIHYFRQSFIDSVTDLFLKGNIDYFDKSIQFIQPPRILLLGTIFILGVLSLFAYPLEITIWWFFLLGVCVIAFLFAIPLKFYNQKTFIALLTLPKGYVLMLKSLLKIKGANKRFIHTQHTNVNDDD